MFSVQFPSVEIAVLLGMKKVPPFGVSNDAVMLLQFMSEPKAVVSFSVPRVRESFLGTVKNLAEDFSAMNTARLICHVPINQRDFTSIILYP